MHVTKFRKSNFDFKIKSISSNPSYEKKQQTLNIFLSFNCQNTSIPLVYNHVDLRLGNSSGFFANKENLAINLREPAKKSTIDNFLLHHVFCPPFMYARLQTAAIGEPRGTNYFMS